MLRGKNTVLGGLYCVVCQLFINFVKKSTSYEQGYQQQLLIIF